MTDFQNAYPDLFALRQTSAEILAAAIAELFPNTRLLGAKAGVDGFSYTFYFPEFTETFLEIIEQKMLEIIKGDRPIVLKTMVYASAKGYLEHLGLKKRMGDADVYHFFEMGGFIDLADSSQLASSKEVSFFFIKGFEKREKGVVEIFGNSFFEKKDFRSYQKKIKKPCPESKYLSDGNFFLEEGIAALEKLQRSWKKELVENGFHLRQNLFPSKKLLPKEKLTSESYLFIEEEVDKRFGLLDTEYRTQSIDRLDIQDAQERKREKYLFSYLKCLVKWLNMLGFDSYSLFLFNPRRKEGENLKRILTDLEVVFETRDLSETSALVSLYIEDSLQRPWKIFELCKQENVYVGKILSFERLLGLLESIESRVL